MNPLRKKLALGAAAGFGLVAAFYWLSPMWTLYALRAAVTSGDAEEIASYVDANALREQLRTKMAAEIVGKHDGKVGIAAALAMSVIDPAINAMMAPSQLKRLIEGGRLALPGDPASESPLRRADWRVARRGLNTFVARPATNETVTASELVFHRNGFGWRLVAVNEVKNELSLAPDLADNRENLVAHFPANRQDFRQLPSGAYFVGISGSITNVGNQTVRLPNIVITLTDGDGRQVDRREIFPSKRELYGKQSLTLNEALTDVPSSVRSAHIEWKTGVPSYINTIDLATHSDIEPVSREGLAPEEFSDSDPVREAKRAAAEAAAAASEAASLAYPGGGFDELSPPNH